MTPDIEQLCREALEDDARATAGPWTARDARLSETSGRKVYAHRLVADCNTDADADVIAAARTREPLLAAALLAERRESERLVEDLRHVRNVLAKAREILVEGGVWGDELLVNAASRTMAKLAAMTAARDEACRIADGLSMYIALDNPYAKPSERRERIAELRTVGKEQP